MFSVQLRGYVHCPDTCEHGGQQGTIFKIQTNARDHIHPHQEARPQCVS